MTVALFFFFYLFNMASKICIRFLKATFLVSNSVTGFVAFILFDLNIANSIQTKHLEGFYSTLGENIAKSLLKKPPHTHTHTYTHTHIYIYIYSYYCRGKNHTHTHTHTRIYIYRERERETERESLLQRTLSIYMSVYVCV